MTTHVRSLGSRLLVAAAVVSLLLTLVTFPVTAVPHPATHSAVDTASQSVSGGGIGVSQQTTPTNNSTVRHQDPDESYALGNRTETIRWVSTRIETAYGQCAQQARPQPNGTCEILSTEADSLAYRYGVLANDTDGTDDDNVTRTLRPAADDQLLFIEAVRSYRAARTDYQVAKNRGGLNETLRLARNVSRQGDRVETIGNRLATRYRNIRSNSSIDITPAIIAVEEVKVNVSEQTTAIRNTEFEAPQLQFTSNPTNVSFTRPVELSGVLQAQNGTPLSNRTVVVSTSETTTRLTTDANGTFNVSYRPELVSPGPTRPNARYLPVNDSRYTTVRSVTQINIQNVSGELSVDVSPTTAAFGDEIRLNGTYDVNGTTVASVPINVTIGDRNVGTVQTDASGAFVTSTRISKSIPNGTVSASASIADDGLALKADQASTEVAINSSEPRILVGTERINASTARIFGRMTVGRTSVPDALIQVRQDGEVIGEGTTGSDGVFEINGSLPETRANETTAVTVVYDPPEGNLDSVALDARIGTAPSGLLPGINRPSRQQILYVLQQTDSLPLIAGGVLAMLLALVFAAIIYRSNLGVIAAVWSRLRRRSRLSGDADGTSPPSAHGEQAGSSTREGLSDRLLESAYTNLSAEQMDEAVVAAYTAAREQLDVMLGIDQTLTHWELLYASWDQLSSADRTALQRLTAAYERAAFSPSQCSGDDAREAVEDADSLVRGSPVEPTATESDD